MPYKDKEKQLEYQRVWKAKRKSSYLKDKSCIKCGSAINLQIDHIHPEKKWTHRIWSYSWKRIHAELKKCQILCSECHLKKTANDIRTMRKKAHGTIEGYVKWHCRCELCAPFFKTVKSEEFTAGISLTDAELVM